MNTADCYRSESTNPAYSLRWSWTGWPSQGTMPPTCNDDWNQLAKTWEQDGIRLLERKCEADYWQATVSTKPNVVPTLIVARIKGRIDYLFRCQKIPFKFSRKVSLRSLGNNTANDVQDYIRHQVDAAKFCDDRFADSLKQFTRVWDNDRTFQAPLEVASGRYWYQLHLVFVVQARHRIRNLPFLGSLFEQVQSIALDRGYHLGGLSVMPDHLHVSLRGRVEDSPEAIALSLMNETSRRLNVVGLWKPSFYAGTIGVYSMDAVRS